MQLINLFKKYLKPLNKIEKLTNYRFNDKNLLNQAFTHRSISNEPNKNYERLEFLGDAVIDIVISRELMKEFSECDEGILTQKRAALVQKSFLSTIGKMLNLLDFIIIEDNVDLSQEKITSKQNANLYEALVGAIYLDGGINPSKKFILNTVWNCKNEAWKSVNYKGQLIEICHIKQLPNPVFQVSNVSGPDHQKLFEVRVSIGKEVYPSGIGTSKKIAEQQAAELAMETIEN